MNTIWPEKAQQIETLKKGIEVLNTKIVAVVKADDAARRQTTIPGVGPIIATTARAAIQDPKAYRTSRDLTAWTGITPRANSSGKRNGLAT